MTGKIPSGSVDIETLWMVEKWNRFDIQSNASYFVLLPSTALPEKNFLKFKLRNEIPTLGSLSLVDSHFFFQTAHLRYEPTTTTSTTANEENNSYIDYTCSLFCPSHPGRHYSAGRRQEERLRKDEIMVGEIKHVNP